MNLKQLRTFIAVAEERSFRKAAERLNLTQPPVSLQISRLEEELGIQLVERGGRKKTRLTVAGKILLNGARQTLRAAERAAESVAMYADGSSGHLRIGHSDDFQHGLLPRVLANFHAEYPGVRVTLNQRRSARVVELLQNGEIDLGFVSLPLPRLNTSYAMHILPATPIVAVVPADHSLAGRQSVWLSDLADERFYLLPSEMDSGFSSQVTLMFARANISPACIGMAEMSNIAVQIIANGLGVTLASLSSIGTRNDDTRILELLDAHASLELSAVYPRALADEPLIQGFLDNVSRTVESMPT